MSDDQKPLTLMGMTGPFIYPPYQLPCPTCKKPYTRREAALGGSLGGGIWLYTHAKYYHEDGTSCIHRDELDAKVDVELQQKHNKRLT